MCLSRPKQRDTEHGEAFSPQQLSERKRYLGRAETDRFDYCFQENGTGNFTVRALSRKIPAHEVCHE